MDWDLLRPGKGIGYVNGNNRLMSLPASASFPMMDIKEKDIVVEEVVGSTLS